MSDNTFLCMGCMEEEITGDICPRCGYDNSVDNPSPFLGTGTRLQDRYVVGRLISSNGESAKYIAYDEVGSSLALMREFLPQNLVSRDYGSPMVSVIPGCENPFREYFDQFMKNIRTAAKLRSLPSVIPIYDIFESNGTAYAVCEKHEHITLREYVENNGGRLSWKIARPLLIPVLNSFLTISSAEIRHLGISPETLILTRDGKVRITGFEIPQVRKQDTDLMPEIYNGYAAYEQYFNNYPLREYTDVYAMAAVFFYVLAGEDPKDARRRKADNRLLIPNEILEQIPRYVVIAIANAMQVLPQERTQTFERFRDEITAAPAIARVVSEAPASEDSPSVRKPPQKKASQGIPRFVYGLISFLLSLALFALIGLAILTGRNSESDPSNPDQSGISVSVAETSEDVPAGDMLPVPSLIGMTFNDATSQNLNFRIFQSGVDYDDNIPEGCIMAQIPDAGGEALPGTSITVMLSNGPEFRPLPEIAGKDADDARVQLAEAGFDVIIVEQNSTYPSGIVIGYRNMRAGDKQKHKSTIEILVSKGG